MTIQFQKIKEKMKFMNPFKDFTLDEMPIEIRYDPLTRQTTRIFNLPYRPIEKPDFDELVAKARETQCPFCPESLEKSTTLYPKEIIPEGRVRVGDACLFPNLLPLDRYTGVCVMTREHFVPIEKFTPGILRDSFTAAIHFIQQLSERDTNVRFFNINWNYMPPAGSSIVHPHLQVNCGEIPTRLPFLQMEASHRYYMENGRTFWDDFMAAEKGLDERYLKDIGSTFWTMSFAPHGALPDISFICKSHSSLIQVEEDDLEHLLQGLSRAITYIDREGLYSFNLSIFSGRENEHFRVNGRITPRILLREIGNSDQTYYQVLHREPCSMKSPESARKRVLELFNSSKI